MDRLGWVPQQGEAERVRQWRGDILRAMGVMGSDSTTIAEAREVLDKANADVEAIDPDVVAAALAIVAANGTMREFDDFTHRFRNAATPQESNRYRRALTSIPESEAALRTFEMVSDGTIRRQDSTGTLALLLGHRDTGAASWQRMTDRWDEVVAAMDPGNLRRMLDFIHFRSEPEIASDIEGWLTAHPLAGSDRHVAQQLERLDVRVGLRSRVAAELGRALADS